mmetsp:Transcript_57273/g.153051  ORF Transcript_57273/g.153051 Transcript_57273/m.153051 type:complete len:285 (-) Transcript_57273:1144-1998(-)
MRTQDSTASLHSVQQGRQMGRQILSSADTEGEDTLENHGRKALAHHRPTHLQQRLRYDLSDQSRSVCQQQRQHRRDHSRLPGAHDHLVHHGLILSRAAFKSTDQIHLLLAQDHAEDKLEHEEPRVQRPAGLIEIVPLRIENIRSSASLQLQGCHRTSFASSVQDTTARTCLQLLDQRAQHGIRTNHGIQSCCCHHHLNHPTLDSSNGLRRNCRVDPLQRSPKMGVQQQSRQDLHVQGPRGSPQHPHGPPPIRGTVGHLEQRCLLLLEVGEVPGVCVLQSGDNGL